MRVAARNAKEAYSLAVSARASRQREVNDMLQRKNTWSDADVLAFTKLVREDHLSASAEIQSKAALESAEAAVDAEFGALMRSILDRYHEEQVWSDKIRSVSTYGSLAALVANMVVFVVAIVWVEPWKRKRLAETFERRVVELSEETREVIGSGVKGLEEHFEKQEKVLAQLAGVTPGGPVPVDHERPIEVPVEDVPEPVKGAPVESTEPMERWQRWIGSLQPSTERDYTLVAIGAVTGLVGSGVVSLLRSSR
ncbi:hypothetical protein BDV93DRAFT_520398 [Ceratobasidium sp. AG-I]|nr:hypothetical protein BDV93DRAFT_520398 [Ceratobasidium sp. AG-I]